MTAADALTLELARIGDGLLGKGMLLATADPVAQCRRLAKFRLYNTRRKIRVLRLMLHHYEQELDRPSMVNV